MVLTSRHARIGDIADLQVVMDEAIAELQRGFLTGAQIESSRAIMGIDTQLIDDGTYFVVHVEGAIAGCGGWSRRATMYGHDSTPRRDSRLLDPRTEAARVRAMYTSRAFTRRGVGRLILSLCAEAAAAEGFTRLELMATLSGQSLYASCGFESVEHIEDTTGGVAVPLIKMVRPVEHVSTRQR
ncbi:MAG: GNAT family N-acetyltransferase [Actinomycetota bacterium]|nr:GNAT family N-acetyltransferase [Actinomycetota bacterium]